MNRYLHVLVLALVLVGSGCASPQTRVKDHPEVYAALPEKERKAVLNGEILLGMSTDAVYLALGSPSEKRREVDARHTYERWIYSESRTEEVPSFQPILIPNRHGGYSTINGYQPHYIRRSRDLLEIKFEKEKVIGWKEL